uniref:Uncharacterized protein n=1 Tax=Panagrellus redivivus TaxID=6233 RepID=A0A7E4ZPZ8_PANRE
MINEAKKVLSTYTAIGAPPPPANDAVEKSKLLGAPSHGAPIKEAHPANVKREPSREVISKDQLAPALVEELQSFNADTFVETHRKDLQKLKLVTYVIAGFALFLLIVLICLIVATIVLRNTHTKKITALRLSTLSRGDWAITSCPPCYGDGETTAKMRTKNPETDAKIEKECQIDKAPFTLTCSGTDQDNSTCLPEK